MSQTRDFAAMFARIAASAPKSEATQEQEDTTEDADLVATADDGQDDVPSSQQASGTSDAPEVIASGMSEAVVDEPVAATRPADVAPAVTAVEPGVAQSRQEQPPAVHPAIADHDESHVETPRHHDTGLAHKPIARPSSVKAAGAQPRKTTTFARIPNEVAALIQARVSSVLADATNAGYVPENTRLSLASILTIYVVWNESIAVPGDKGERLIQSTVKDKELAHALATLRASKDPMTVLSERMLSVSKTVDRMSVLMDAITLMESYDLADRLALRKGPLPSNPYAIDFDDDAALRLRNAASNAVVAERRERQRQHNVTYENSLRKRKQQESDSMWDGDD